MIPEAAPWFLVLCMAITVVVGRGRPQDGRRQGVTSECQETETVSNVA